MALYSVWSFRDKHYAYYQAPELRARGAVPHRFRPPLGDPPELLMPRIPTGAKLVGYGQCALGRIAQLPDDLE